MAEVHLDHVAPGAVSGVGDRHGHGDAVLLRHERGVAPLEGGVRHPVSERKCRFHAGARVEAVADVVTLPVLHLATTADVLVRREPHRVRERLGETSARLGIAHDHVGHRGTTGLSAQVGLDDRRGAVGPRHQDGRPVAQHDDRARVGRTHGSHQFVVRRGKCQGGAVVPLRLVDRRKADEHHRDVGSPGRSGRFGHDRRIRPPGDGVVAGCVPNRSPEALLEHATSGVEAGRHDVRAPGALDARLVGERADDGDVRLRRDGEDPVVAEQHRSRCSGSAGEPVMTDLVERAGLVLVTGWCRPARDPTGQLGDGDRTVDHERTVEVARLDGIDHGVVVGAAARGHLQIDAGPHRCDPIVDPAPVGDDEAVEPPVVTEDILHQERAVGDVVAVDEVVRRHHGPRASVADGDLETSQIDLAQRPLVDDHVADHPIRLVVVGDEVLQAGADTLRLHPTGHGCGETPRHHGILGEVLEVASAGRMTLDVQARSEEHPDALCPRLATQRRADLLDQRRVPGGAETRRGRKAGRRQRVAQTEMIGAVGLSTDSVGPVRQDERPDADLGHLDGRPEVPPGQHLDLAFEGQVADASSDLTHPSGLSPFRRTPDRRARPSPVGAQR